MVHLELESTHTGAIPFGYSNYNTGRNSSDEE